MRKFLLSAGLAIAAIIGLNMHTSNAYASDPVVAISTGTGVKVLLANIAVKAPVVAPLVVLSCGVAADEGSSLCKSIGIFPNATTPKVSSLADFQAPIMAQVSAYAGHPVDVAAETRAKLSAEYAAMGGDGNVALASVK